jgi:ABC-type transport system involved in multi-copper enzyme maturation permease subunit
MNFKYLVLLEWKKFSRNTVMILLIGLYTLLMPFGIFVLENWEGGPGMPSKDVFFTFPQIWEYQGYSGSWFSFLFLGFIGVLLITTEVGQKTMRQNIITGITRTEFYLGKLYVMILVALYATVIYILSTILIGSLYPETIDFSNFMEGHNGSAPRYFLMTFAYLSFGLFLGLILRKSGLAIFIYLAYIIFLEPMLRWGVHREIFDHRSMNFYPMNAIEDLMPNPLFRFVESFQNMTDFNILLTYREATVVTLISVGVFLFLAYRSLVRRDM